jgi:mono/diheme cytochrome c family protein
MKLRIALVLGCLGAMGAIAASATAQTAPGTGSPVAADATSNSFGSARMFSEKTGEELYRNVCAGCHMPDAKGAQGAGFYPALAGNKKLIASGYPVMVVLKGLNGMPPVGSMMSDQQVADVVNHVRTNFGNRYRDAVKPEDVKALR